MISCEVFGAVAVVYLNDTGRLNVLSRNLIQHLNMELDRLETHPDVHVLILTGYDRIFSAGADLKEVIDYKKFSEDDDFVEPWQRLYQFTKPVIVAINGVAAGGGLELALMGDIIFASELARIGQPELSVGVIPGGGATQRLTRLIGPYLTNYLCMTGMMISAPQALEWGIVQGVLPDRELLPYAIEIGQKIAERPLALLKKFKECVQFAHESSLNDGMQFERKKFFTTFDLKDHSEAINAFFEKRHPTYTHEE